MSACSAFAAIFCINGQHWLATAEKAADQYPL
jgi:hypothetical protein